MSLQPFIPPQPKGQGDSLGEKASVDKDEDMRDLSTSISSGGELEESCPTNKFGEFSEQILLSKRVFQESSHREYYVMRRRVERGPSPPPPVPNFNFSIFSHLPNNKKASQTRKPHFK
jgi:hypothetical protein